MGEKKREEIGLRIVYMGTPEFAVPSLYQLLMAGHDVCLVVTQPDRRRGRGHKMKPSPIKEVAEEFGIPVFQPARIKVPEAIDFICSQKPELIVVVAYGQILPSEILRCPEYGSINVHGSLLPAYRGPAPIQRAIMDGESVTGVTTMYMDETMDTGDIILQKQIEILPDTTCGELAQKLSELGAELLLETVDQIQWGVAPRIPQNDELATYAPFIKSEDEIIDWSRTAVQIHNQIRGLNPRPGAYTRVDDIKIKVFQSRIIENDVPGSIPGEVTEVNDEGFAVQTGQGTLLALEVQRAGKKRMSTGQFLKGFDINPGLRLGNG
jgi:methionyl-tRNA formyltransferase